MKTTQVKWINCAKMVAILAVLIDHTSGILYTDSKIAEASYFSVSLFIIIAGMTNYSSYSRIDRRWKNVFKCKKILVDYAIATFVYYFAQTRFFDLKTYLQLLIGFDATGPFYFVLLYLQLTLISRFLFHYLQRCSETMNKETLYEMLGMLFIIFFSAISTNYTNILDVYGGGGYYLEVPI